MTSGRCWTWHTKCIEMLVLKFIWIYPTDKSCEGPAGYCMFGINACIAMTSPSPTRVSVIEMQHGGFLPRGFDNKPIFSWLMLLIVRRWEGMRRRMLSQESSNSFHVTVSGITIPRRTLGAFPSNISHTLSQLVLITGCMASLHYLTLDFGWTSVLFLLATHGLSLNNHHPRPSSPVSEPRRKTKKIRRTTRACGLFFIIFTFLRGIKCLRWSRFL